MSIKVISDLEYTTSDRIPKLQTILTIKIINDAPPSYNTNFRSVINLDGPEGNPIILAGILKNSFQLSGDGNSTDKVIEEMLSEPYPHAVKVFKKYCGDSFSLTTENKELLKHLTEAA